jgi:hypothetical protein
MKQKTEEPIGGLTRRKALKAGAVLSSGLAFGGAAIGTVGAEDMSAKARAVPMHLSLRAMGDSEPSPVPDPQDKIVHRVSGNPVDDGTDHEELDGTHHFRWGEYRALEGVAKMDCVDDGGDVETEVTVEVGGLVKGGLYTIWVCELVDPGIVDDRDPTVALQNLVGCNPLGKNDGSENVFRATGGVGTLEVTDMPGAYTLVPPWGSGGSSPDCLLETDQTILVGVLHLDDKSHGPVPGDPVAGDHVDHFAFMF